MVVTTASLTIPNFDGGSYAFDFVVYVVNQSQWFVISADLPSSTTPYLTSGQVIASGTNFGAGPLNGAYLFAVAGYDAFSAGNDSTIGVFQTGGIAGPVSNASVSMTRVTIFPALALRGSIRLTQSIHPPGGST